MAAFNNNSTFSYPAARLVSAYYKANEVLVQPHGTDLKCMSIVVPMFVNLHVRNSDLSRPAIPCKVGKLFEWKHHDMLIKVI